MSHGTREQDRVILDFEYKAFTFFGNLFQNLLLSLINLIFLAPQPPENLGLGFSAFAHRY